MVTTSSHQTIAGIMNYILDYLLSSKENNFANLRFKYVNDNSGPATPEFKLTRLDRSPWGPFCHPGSVGNFPCSASLAATWLKKKLFRYYFLSIGFSDHVRPCKTASQAWWMWLLLNLKLSFTDPLHWLTDPLLLHLIRKHCHKISLLSLF